MKNFRQIWSEAGRELRLAAAKAMLENKDTKAEAMAVIVARCKVRPKVVKGLPVEKQASFLLNVAPDEAMSAMLIREYLFSVERPMLSLFLDTLGLKHNNGELPDSPQEPLDDALLTSALAKIKAEYPADRVLLYTDALAASDPGVWGKLPELLPAA